MGNRFAFSFGGGVHVYKECKTTWGSLHLCTSGYAVDSEISQIFSLREERLKD